MEKKNSFLAKKLKQYFGFDSFKGEQEAIIENLMAGHDTFVLMPTGGGKSLCYQLPSLLMEGMAIVISPLIALMKNQVDAMRHMSEDDGIAHFINSSLNKATIDKVKQDILDQKTKLLFVAPESLTKPENIQFLQKVKISFYAIDEAHCISEWGHDFRPEYRRIRPIINEIGTAPVIALTATATDKVRMDIKKNLEMPDAKEFKSSFNRPNLYYEVRPKTQDVEKEIIKFIKSHPGKSGIVYCLSRKHVEELAEVLKANAIKAEPYHAGIDSAQRSKTQDDFLMERIDVIVATIAFGMGIDKPDVRFVIHYDIPKSLEGYYQETGRAGRDGGEGICIAFYNRKDVQKLEKFIEGKPVAEQEIGRLLLKETAAYAESSICRRKMLLHYFGENYDKENCGNCDNCLSPQKKIEAQDTLINILKVVLACADDVTEDYIKSILIGHRTEEILAHKHNQLELFGCYAGGERSGRELGSIIKQAQIEGYLERNIENFGTLRITSSGKEFLKHPKPFMVSMDRNFDEESDAHADRANAIDPTLYRILKDLRKQMAKEQNIPPYVIFQDVSLEAMATIYPESMEDLLNIPGVGVGKAKRYGQRFCDLIKQYCVENEVERPVDLRIRTVANKSKLKVSIVQSIDRKVALDDIAVVKGIEFEELLDEVEAIVYSGTRINIDYFINDVMDEECVNDIYQYFRESETDDIAAAVEELGNDYTEEEIRLVRIKFISEMAN